ncbi:endonuclease Q family protein [Paenibacillus sp. N4]|uniref:endonuclease Q family protein n=1 Tax=Paenibacillus vietnamensis TaxID=2590547 RepID=UPI001CD18226|nr:endonuclease Q family protein [Paenibacillus vietnamensis]MCA0755504.1 endonuclease Q family protein [Paenibacillus vietnamensis]
MLNQQTEAGGSASALPLQSIFADLHVHIGSSASGLPVKISASRGLTFRSIAHEASIRKGVRLIGVIDCHSPAVQDDIMKLLDAGEMEEAEGGGIRYRDTVILLGAEMEIREPGGGPFHLLGYLPNLQAMQSWTEWMKPRMKNVQLSSQRIHSTARELQNELLARGGLLAPAHVFTPHRGLLGCSADRLEERLDPGGIAAVELGLSADTEMAERLSQLDRYPFLTNSDAHSTGMIARECNELLLREPSFAEFAKALRGEEGRGIAANYGLHPRLGKYHTTWCLNCHKAVPEGLQTESEAMKACPACGSLKLVRGVAERIDQLADRGSKAADSIMQQPSDGSRLQRPPYWRQVPLSFFPGVGPKMRDRLLTEVGTEMEILFRVTYEQLSAVTGEKIAGLILAAREQRVDFIAGSGGTYGKLTEA